MQNYDKLTFVILNRILGKFGMRIKAGAKVVYLYRRINYTLDLPVTKLRIIQLSDNVETAFTFLKMDYRAYKKKEFKHIMEYVSYMTDNCPYFTKDIVKYLRDQLDMDVFKEDEELKKQVVRFVRTIVMSHAVVRDFDFSPIHLYSNLKEAIVRNHYSSPQVTDQIVQAKLELREDKDLIGKFSGGNVVNWIRELRKDSTLTGMFTLAFVNYKTNGVTKDFPKYLIDKDKTIIKTEVLKFYSNIFIQSDEYLIYLLEGKDEASALRLKNYVDCS
jgi:hypothetical protein